MKLQIVLAPTKPDWWRITITVMHKEDFPTVRIFQDYHDYPSGENYVLFPGDCNYISNIFSTKRAAHLWAAMQISALKDALLEWRDPPEKEVQHQYI